MNWDIKLTTQTEELLFVLLCIVAGLLLISFVRILLLLRGRRKMAERTEKLEQQILDQQKTILDIRSDANAWRGEMQRQFDAHRADAARRLDDAELRAAGTQNRLDIATEQHDRRLFELQASLDAARRMCAELPAAKARIIELEKLLANGPAEGLNGHRTFTQNEIEELAAATKAVSTPGLPMLPSMEALQTQPESDDASESDDSLSLLRQRNAELERALLLARRRKPAARAKDRKR
jgi:hypothetical protein